MPIADVVDVVPVLADQVNQLRREVVVEQQLHAVVRSGSSRSRTASAA